MKVLLFAVLIALVAPVQAQHKILDMNPPKAKAPMKRRAERMGPSVLIS